jgi:hypothetical protein
MENNFGLIRIDWERSDPIIDLEIHDVTGNKRIGRTIKLSELSF